MYLSASSLFLYWYLVSRREGRNISFCHRPIGCKLPVMRACSHSRDRACDSDLARSVVHAHRDRENRKVVEKPSRDEEESASARPGTRSSSLAPRRLRSGFIMILAPTKILRRCRCTRPDEILIDIFNIENISYTIRSYIINSSWICQGNVDKLVVEFMFHYN